MEVRIATCWNQLSFLALLQNEDCPANWRNPSVTLTGWETNLTWICSRPPFWGFFPNFYTATSWCDSRLAERLDLGPDPRLSECLQGVAHPGVWSVFAIFRQRPGTTRLQNTVQMPGWRIWGDGWKGGLHPHRNVVMLLSAVHDVPWQNLQINRGNGTLLSTPEVVLYVWWF